jgi:4-hydroxy-tetrahydrodipicolinate synthase
MPVNGVFVPVITPFTTDDQVDLAALKEQIDFVIEGGVHGVIPAGGTGECQSLSEDEYKVVIRETVEHVRGRVPVFAGASANSTRHTVEKCAYAAFAGANGVMIGHPYYSLPDEDELYAHYEVVASTTDLPIMIYNNPFTTGVDSRPELLARLSMLEHIESVKESSGVCSRVMRIIELSDGRLSVMSGADNLALEHFSAGACGWVASAGNVLPSQCVELYSLAVEKQQADNALALYHRLHEYLTICETTGKFVQVAKAGIEYLGRQGGPPRRPLLPLSAGLLQRTHSAIDRARDVIPV